MCMYYNNLIKTIYNLIVKWEGRIEQHIKVQEDN